MAPHLHVAGCVPGLLARALAVAKRVAMVRRAVVRLSLNIMLYDEKGG